MSLLDDNLDSADSIFFFQQLYSLTLLIARNQGHFEPANNYQRYIVLYNLSTADLLFDEKKKKRRPASKSLGFLEAKR